MSTWLESLNNQEIKQIKKDMPSLSHSDLVSLKQTLTRHYVTDVMQRLQPDFDRWLRIKEEQDHV